VIESIEKGTVKALILVEVDPFWSFPDQERLKQAIGKLDLLLVVDYLPSQAARFAHIFLPTQTLFEMETSFVNQEGRVQFAAAAYCGGTPISQISAGGHPPRVFRRDIPGGEPEPAWAILAKLANAMRSPGEELIPLSRDAILAWLAEEYPAFAKVQPPGKRGDDVRIILGQGKGNPFSACRQSERERKQDGNLDLLLVDWTFATEELSAYSRYVRQVEENPCLFMHPRDASRAGVAHKDRCTLHLDGGSVELEVHVVEGMAPGVVILPKHRQLAWQKVKRWPSRVGIDQIRKSFEKE
jgi:anaerobic selenocysteine-containing dehydrogenase